MKTNIEDEKELRAILDNYNFEKNNQSVSHPTSDSAGVISNLMHIIKSEVDSMPIEEESLYSYSELEKEFPIAKTQEDNPFGLVVEEEPDEEEVLTFNVSDTGIFITKPVEKEKEREAQGVPSYIEQEFFKKLIHIRIGELEILSEKLKSEVANSSVGFDVKSDMLEAVDVPLKTKISDLYAVLKKDYITLDDLTDDLKFEFTQKVSKLVSNLIDLI